MLFQKNIITKYLATLTTDDTDRAWTKYENYFLNADIQQNIRQSKEEQFQEGFLRELFVKVLGYTLNPSPDYNLITEKKNETNSKKADGAIEKDGQVIGIIELKDHKTTDLSKVEQQAFGYKSQHPAARLVVISNFEKLRLYIDNSVEYREWDLFRITKEEFCELYLCLAWEQVASGVAIKIKQESVSSEDQITKALYKDYTMFKRALFADVVKNNPAPEGYDEKDWQLLMFKKTQKLLDRLLFIFFSEDCGLLPPNLIMQMMQRWQTLKDNDFAQPLYDIFKQHFNYLNEGYAGKQYEIFAYNGGLFKPDEVLDHITISDELLAEHTRRLSNYDFKSDVDVNILGHIFENSLSEIEEITQQINSGTAPQASKRKQDGVFYTPQYITKYIVEQTVGRLCAEKKRELNIKEEDYFTDQRRQIQTKRRLLDQLEQYREWLLQITILDPACGSGAFLNAALQWLMMEHKLIDEMKAKLTGSTIVFSDIENSILENNLFGVDINEESVGIAQLALWLRTAKKNRKLNTLNKNVKCGNSLISDPAIAGDKAFDWQKEFPQVFTKGGFDVVIGNPPYVQLQSMGEMSDAYAKCGFETYNKGADLYCLFYEKGCKLLKEKGLLGFIASNKWLKINYGIQLRKYLSSDMNPLLLVDFPGVPVFEDATVDPQILIVEKSEYKGETFACSIKQRIEDLAPIIDANQISITFSEEPWTIRDNRISAILSKMDKCGLALKELPIEINYGIKTGYNDAFFIDEVKRREIVEADKRSANLIYPLLRGRDITAWTSEKKPQYLICTLPSLSIDIDNYTAIKEHLLTFGKERLEQTGAKGARKKTSNKWFETQDTVSYFKEFSKPKIIYPNMTKYLPFSYDESGAVCNDKAFFMTCKDGSISPKFLLAVLNSGLIKLWIRNVCPELGEDRREVRKVYFEKMHVPTSDQQPFIALADKMLTLHKELQEKRNRFLRRLSENIGGVKITSALQSFDQMTFAEFTKELKKQKIRFSLSQQDEWEDYFNQRKTDCQQLSDQIAETDNEINQRVFDLYGLTDEERRIVVKG
ncbi:MAG: Eco57I restriction-modification methylase domain-containing protein [Prevotella sp.]|nr:Eco57I restriction-modification methylase domain-containing protein [Prevotella sp.]